MLNIIWPVFLILSFLYGIISGRVSEINTSIFDSTKSAIELSLSLLGTICLWNGIMQIASKTRIIKFLEKILNPITKKIFPDINKNEIIHKEITMNIIANIMGLGNAATPLGLKAMKSLQKKNKEKKKIKKLNVKVIVLKTTINQIIPNKGNSLRSSLGSNNPAQMMVPVWISTILSASAAILFAKLLMKKY